MTGTVAVALSWGHLPVRCEGTRSGAPEQRASHLSAVCSQPLCDWGSQAASQDSGAPGRRWEEAGAGPWLPRPPQCQRRCLNLGFWYLRVAFRKWIHLRLLVTALSLWGPLAPLSGAA